MLWKLSPEETPAAGEPVPGQGRFILHRHADAGGPHLDLRLEAGPCLVGWRIDAAGIDDVSYAVEKPPHPLHWLDRDGDAVRQDVGTYAWIDQDEDGGLLELRGASVRRLSVRKAQAPSPSALGFLIAQLNEHRIEPSEVVALVQDGRVARHRAMLRLCALGRELDGGAFDESRWKDLLGNASLDEIHHHLRTYEVRFDAKYPPQPVSQPEPLPEENEDRRDTAWTILQSQ